MKLKFVVFICLVVTLVFFLVLPTSAPQYTLVSGTDARYDRGIEDTSYCRAVFTEKEYFFHDIDVYSFTDAKIVKKPEQLTFRVCDYDIHSQNLFGIRDSLGIIAQESGGHSLEEKEVAFYLWEEIEEEYRSSCVLRYFYCFSRCADPVYIWVFTATLSSKADRLFVFITDQFQGDFSKYALNISSRLSNNLTNWISSYCFRDAQDPEEVRLFQGICALPFAPEDFVLEIRYKFSVQLHPLTMAQFVGKTQQCQKGKTPVSTEELWTACFNFNLVHLEDKGIPYIDALGLESVYLRANDFLCQTRDYHLFEDSSHRASIENTFGLCSAIDSGFFAKRIFSNYNDGSYLEDTLKFMYSIKLSAEGKLVFYAFYDSFGNCRASVFEVQSGKILGLADIDYRRITGLCESPTERGTFLIMFTDNGDHLFKEIAVSGKDIDFWGDEERETND